MFVVVHPKKGVYLASCGGIDIWSKIDPLGVDTAMTFSSFDEASEHFAVLNIDISKLKFVEVEVDTDLGGFASMCACIESGLDRWETDEILQPA